MFGRDREFFCHHRFLLFECLTSYTPIYRTKQPKQPALYPYYFYAFYCKRIV
ncbi:hypothetical protein HMPREF0476_1947 [Kingella kingae ATCC 23330]|uniref:Uncharacterized protein n=1 Tax=Kingella kingae ATCC 23330 TaxID=887327 RepID=F5S9R4_KINKI|nr:hypothetical protein HMPREF0476_1947 [Kingella kingae ATCC 23330]